VQRHETAVDVADLKNARRRALARALRLGEEIAHLKPQSAQDLFRRTPREAVEQHPSIAAHRDAERPFPVVVRRAERDISLARWAHASQVGENEIEGGLAAIPFIAII
jgi:hypothetical protein